MNGWNVPGGWVEGMGLVRAVSGQVKHLLLFFVCIFLSYRLLLDLVSHRSWDDFRLFLFLTFKDCMVLGIYFSVLLFFFKYGAPNAEVTTTNIYKYLNLLKNEMSVSLDEF